MTAVVTVVIPVIYCTWVTVGRTRTGVGPVEGVVTGDAVVINSSCRSGTRGFRFLVPEFAVVFSPGCTHPPMRMNRITIMMRTIATMAILKYGCFHTGTRPGFFPFGAAAYPPP